MSCEIACGRREKLWSHRFHTVANRNYNIRIVMFSFYDDKKMAHLILSKA
jgi:hypothetical protein